MDSKTKRLTILLLSLVILVVVGAIVLVNYQEIIGKKGVKDEEAAPTFQNLEQVQMERSKVRICQHL